MPDSEGNLLPGEEGYVAPPVETPAAETVVAPNADLTLREELQDVEHKLAEEEEQPKITDTSTIDVVSKASFDALLAAYTKLKVRVSLDPMYEKQLDAEAGL